MKHKFVCVLTLAISIFSLFFVSQNTVQAKESFIDSDKDLIPDTWEVSYSLDPHDSADADLDPDNDRLTNRDEWFSKTDPTIYTDAHAMSDRALLNLFKGKAFLFFWEQSKESNHFFTCDNAVYNDKNSGSGYLSIATTGFSLIAYMVADEADWVDREEAYNRIRHLLSYAVQIQNEQSPTDYLSRAGREGFLYHWVDGTGHRSGGSEISTVDHGFLVAGALAAGEYYKGTEVESLARTLYENTNWKWLYGAMYPKYLAMGWQPEFYGKEEDREKYDYDHGYLTNGGDIWNRYSELLSMMIISLANYDAGNPSSKSLPPEAWQTLYNTNSYNELFHMQRMVVPSYTNANFRWYAFPDNAAQLPNVFFYKNGLPHEYFKNSNTQFSYLHAGSLHNHQYSHLFIDFRNRKCTSGGDDIDFFANSVNATIANRQFCMSLKEHEPTNYESYGPNDWGLMAGVGGGSRGYIVMQPPLDGPCDALDVAINTDSGTLLPNAPLGSMPFIPREATDFCRAMLTRYQAGGDWYGDLIGRYGLINAFNRGYTFDGARGHFASATVGLDMGPIVGSIENMLTGLPWKFTMRNALVKDGLEVAGFDSGAVEPSSITFESGSNPNPFGGYAYPFGLARAYYTTAEAHGGTYSYAIETATDGAFMMLNNRSVSNWDELSFWIKASPHSTLQYSVGLKDSVRDLIGSNLEAAEVKVPIAEYHPQGRITEEWTKVTIPLRAFTTPSLTDGTFIGHFPLQTVTDDSSWGIRTTALDNISFTCTGGSGDAVFIDDIMFGPDTQAPTCPTGLALTQSGTSVLLTWSHALEPDVVGYHVYRSTAGGPTVRLTSHLIVDTAYTDTIGSGAYTYVVTAVDNAETPHESTPSLPVQALINTAPQLDTVSNASLITGTLYTQTITASDPDTGDTLTFSASLADGSSLDTIGATLSHSNGIALFSWTPEQAQGSPSGTLYSILIRVTDSHGAYDEAFMTATVLRVNHAPLAHAGSSQIVRTGSLVTLDGSQSSDPDNDVLTYTWRILSQPAGSSISLTSQTSVHPTCTPQVPGEYIVELIVSDGTVSSAPATVSITVEEQSTAPHLEGTVSLLTYRGQKEATSGGVRVYLWGRSQDGKWLPLLCVRTQANGTYSFTGIPYGTYILYASTPGYRFSPLVKTCTFSQAQNQVPPFTGRASSLGSKPPKSGIFSISGSITNSRTQTHVAQAVVTLRGYDIYKQSVSLTILTDSNGTYSFENLAPGTYTVAPQARGWSQPQRETVVITTGHRSGIHFSGPHYAPWYRIFHIAIW